MRTYLFQLCGVDLTRIDGIDVTTAFKVLTEVGADLSRFKDAKHFASGRGLCPGTKISGGKVLSAANLRSSQSALGAYYRRLCARMDKPRAVTACAHKLARLIYTMVAKGEEYVDRGQDDYEERQASAWSSYSPRRRSSSASNSSRRRKMPENTAL